MEPEILLNPVVKWAVHPADQGRIAYIDGPKPAEKLPEEGAVITRPFLVDPNTRHPVPVRVVQVLKLWEADRQGHTLAVVVTRDQ